MLSMKILYHWLVGTIAILVAAYIVPGVTVTLAGAIIAAVVLGALNLFVRPVIRLITLPITILTLAVSGALTIASRSIIAAEISRDQLTASHIAQEGIEYVHLVRDNNYLSAFQAGGATISATAWVNFLGAVAACGTSCLYDPAAPSLTACSGSSCTRLYLAPTHIYTQQSGSGTITPFTRVIQITAVSATEEKVVSTVSWNFHGTTYSVGIVDHLTPWQ